MKDLFPTQNRCPYCHSDNAVPINTKSIVSTGAGGVIGGIVAALSGKNKAGGISAGSVVTGVITGILTGAGLSKVFPKDESDKLYFCLDCCRTFTGNQIKFPY
jgi:hypothetical protein